LISIVFLHGLRGNTFDTWVKDGVLWPKDLLAEDISDSRIFLFGFDAGITHLHQGDVTLTELESDAEDLCAKLAGERAKTSTARALKINDDLRTNSCPGRPSDHLYRS
jgi:protein SERAC1